MSFMSNFSIKLFSDICSYIKSFDLESGKVQLPEKKDDVHVLSPPDHECWL